MTQRMSEKEDYWLKKLTVLPSAQSPYKMAAGSVEDWATEQGPRARLYALSSTSLYQLLKRANFSAPMNHCMAIGANDGQLTHFRLGRLRAITERVPMMDVGKTFADFAIHFKEVESASRDFASQPPRCRHDFPNLKLAHPLLASTMQPQGSNNFPLKG